MAQDTFNDLYSNYNVTLLTMISNTSYVRWNLTQIFLFSWGIKTRIEFFCLCYNKQHLFKTFLFFEQWIKFLLNNFVFRSLRYGCENVAPFYTKKIKQFVRKCLIFPFLLSSNIIVGISFSCFVAILIRFYLLGSKLLGFRCPLCFGSILIHVAVKLVSESANLCILEK